MSLYVGINNTPTKISKLLVGVNGNVKNATTAYAGGVNSNPSKVFESFNLDTELTKVNPVKLLTSGKITANDIGKTVYLSNSAIKCQEWLIADVNHDGTSGTVDLINKIADTGGTAMVAGILDIWGDTVYNGFDNTVKSALTRMSACAAKYERSYNSKYGIYEGTPYVTIKTVEGYVIILSAVEAGWIRRYGADYFYIGEGTKYPIFDNRSLVFDGNMLLRSGSSYYPSTSQKNTFYYGYIKYDRSFGYDTYMSTARPITRIRFTKK